MFASNYLIYAIIYNFWLNLFRKKCQRYIYDCENMSKMSKKSNYIHWSLLIKESMCFLCPAKLSHYTYRLI